MTPEQEALIPVYREKWRAIALSTEPIDREKAANSVKNAYAASGDAEPEIIFCDSPYAALTEWGSQLASQLVGKMWIPLWMTLGGNLRNQLSIQLRKQGWGQLRSQLEDRLAEQLISQLRSQLESQLRSQLAKQLSDKLWNSLRSRPRSPVGSQCYNCIQPESWACSGSFIDFCISVLNYECDRIKWEAFQSLVSDCGWIFPYANIALVCDRPRVLCFDNQQRLHAEGSPAIQFVDGYSLYAYRGVRLTEKYGKMHPHQWQAQWLLSESNAELRRVLMQGIGYDRICQELQAVELDTWQEYALLKIDHVDVEPMYLLKMTCPSTGFIHALRVPPDVNSARESIRWVNWGTEPEEFSVQT